MPAVSHPTRDGIQTEEFRRTGSRLIEMRSEEYRAAAYLLD